MKAHTMSGTTRPQTTVAIILGGSNPWSATNPQRPQPALSEPLEMAHDPAHFHEEILRRYDAYLRREIE